MERQILASTVRIKWRVSTKKADGSGYNSVGSIGHATVMEGRYLVTHNHTGIVSLSNPRDGEIVEIAVYTVDGELIWEGPLAAITVVLEEAETLALDFGTLRDKGMFARRGMGSAEFRAWGSLSLRPGMEVAQVDWNGTTAHVDWIEIESVITNNGTPRLELVNFRAGCIWGRHFLERLSHREQLVPGDHTRQEEWGRDAPLQCVGPELGAGGSGGFCQLRGDRRMRRTATATLWNDP